MARVKKAINVGIINEHNAADLHLPLIPLANKKASKNDTPLEKEIRKFNRLVKQLHEWEAEAAKQKQNDELYEQLYQQQLIPELRKLALVKYRFVVHLHQLFQEGKFSKTDQRHFTDFVLNLLHSAEEFVPEAHELKREYLNQQIRLMNKREKEQFKNLMQADGFELGDMSEYDVKDVWEQGEKQNEKDFFQQHENFFQQKKEAHLQNKKEVQEHQDINVLYKELVKLLHPDLEQDEKVREQKEHLMKELVEARQQKDLHALLLIKAKAQQLLQAAGIATQVKDEAYSLSQLKRYNKELKKKLDEHKNSFVLDIFSSFGFTANVVGDFARHTNPQEEIKQQIKEIKKNIKHFEEDIRGIQSPRDLYVLIDMHKEFIKERY